MTRWPVTRRLGVAVVTGRARARPGHRPAPGADGFDVVLGYRASPDAAEALADEIEQPRAGTAVTVGGDVADAATAGRAR